LERSISWLIEKYRSEKTRTLVNKARLAAAQVVAGRQANLRTPARRPVVLESAETQAGDSPDQNQGTERQPAEPDEPQPDALAGMCAGVAMRDLNLVDSLLAQLETMEASEDDPDTLARFYRLDHLGTRLRRNAENLRVLSGQDSGATGGETANLVDVIRAAMSAIEHYRRIQIGWVATLGIVDFAAEDVSRLVSELLDNATTWSPPTSDVTVSAHLTEQGSVLVRIEDAGIGLTAERLDELNQRLDADPLLDNDSIEHMGLAVVRRLAGKHGIRASLRARNPHGTLAIVVLPTEIVCEAPPAAWFNAENKADTEHAAAEHATAGPSGPQQETLAARAGNSRSEGARHALRPRSPRPYPQANNEDAATATSTTSTTRSGLPRRVPHSLRDPAGTGRFEAIPKAPEEAPEAGPDAQVGQEQLLADLTAFSEGEEAANEVRRTAEARAANEDEDPTQ
jgi:signal transduction histidine kinase